MPPWFFSWKIDFFSLIIFFPNTTKLIKKIPWLNITFIRNWSKDLTPMIFVNLFLGQNFNQKLGKFWKFCFSIVNLTNLVFFWGKFAKWFTSQNWKEKTVLRLSFVLFFMTFVPNRFDPSTWGKHFNLFFLEGQDYPREAVFSFFGYRKSGEI